MDNVLKKETIPKQHTRFCKGLYYTETQSNILIIVTLLQPELEKDISTPAGQKLPEHRQVSSAQP